MAELVRYTEYLYCESSHIVAQRVRYTGGICSPRV